MTWCAFMIGVESGLVPSCVIAGAGRKVGTERGPRPGAWPGDPPGAGSPSAARIGCGCGPPRPCGSVLEMPLSRIDICDFTACPPAPYVHPNGL